MQSKPLVKFEAKISDKVDSNTRALLSRGQLDDD